MRAKVARELRDLARKHSEPTTYLKKPNGQIECRGFRRDYQQMKKIYYATRHIKKV